MAHLYNPTPGPVVIDDGRVIGGEEHAEHTLTDLVREHIEAGRLIRTDTPTKGTSK